MPNVFDDEVRASAMAQVRRLRELYGGRIPRAALMEGISLRGERIPIWNYQKGIFKPAILGARGAALSIQTSAESPYDDVHDSDAGVIGYRYRGQEASHPDNVALRQAMIEQRPLIYLVAVDPGFYDAILPVYVVADNPGALQLRVSRSSRTAWASARSTTRRTMRTSSGSIRMRACTSERTFCGRRTARCRSTACRRSPAPESSCHGVAISSLTRSFLQNASTDSARRNSSCSSGRPRPVRMAELPNAAR